jgi:putative peptidoglycan lipid II flippase
MISRITGFGRFVAIAAVLGPTFFGNLFEATNLLPNLAFELLTGPLIAAMLVPALVRLLDANKRESLERLAGGFLGVLVVVFTVAVAVVIAAGPLVLGLLTILVPDAGIRSDQLTVGWPLLAMLMPQAIFYAVAATGVAVQNAHNKFRLAAAAPAIENVGIMVVMAVSAGVYGFGVEVNEVETGQLLLLGLGTTAAVGLHAALQWLGAKRVGVRLLPKAGWRNPDVRRMLRLAVPSSGYASLNAARTIGLLVAAGMIPGGVIAFQLGRYFFNLPVAIAARPVITAQLPRLSRAYGEKDDERFLATYRNGINLILFVAVPASLLLLALAAPMARAAAYGEMASGLGIALAAVAIGTLAPGIVGESLFLAATSACYSRDDARTPLRATVWRVVLTFVGIAIAVMVGEGIVVLAILGLTVAVSDLLAGFGLHEALLRAIPSDRKAAKRSDTLINLAIAALSVGAGAAFAALSRAAGIPGRFAEAVLGTLAVVLVYLVLQRLRHSPELDELLAVFKRTERA